MRELKGERGIVGRERIERGSCREIGGIEERGERGSGRCRESER